MQPHQCELHLLFTGDRKVAPLLFQPTDYALCTVVCLCPVGDNAEILFLAILTGSVVMMIKITSLYDI